VGGAWWGEALAIGEDQILGQVRDAFQAARAAGTAGALLARAFDLALRLGKRTRRETELAKLGADLPRLALRHARTELLNEGPGPVVLLGTGAMARDLLARRPKDAHHGWRIVGRSRERTQILAAECGCEAQTLEAFLAEEAPFRALLAATRVTEPVVGLRLLERRLPCGAAVVDLGMPRNVHAEARAHCRLADLAELSQLAESNAERL